MFIIIKHKKVQSQDQQWKQLHFGEEQEVGHILEQQPPCILQRKTSISCASVCLLAIGEQPHHYLNRNKELLYGDTPRKKIV